MENNNFISNLKYYKLIASFIGLVSLIGSFYTIFNNLKRYVGIYFALAVPVSADLLIIYLLFSVISMTSLGYITYAKTLKYISYSLMIGSLYLNNISSIDNHSIISFISHTFIVFAWIICSEILVKYAKHNYEIKLKIIQKEDTEQQKLLEKQHKREEEQYNINLQKQIRRDKLEEEIMIRKLDNNKSDIDYKNQDKNISIDKTIEFDDI